MAANIPAGLTGCALIFVLIFNIAALSNGAWFYATADVSGGTYSYYFGLTEAEFCVSYSGYDSCNSESYSKLSSDKDLDSKVQNSYAQTQAGGGLAIAMLVLNIILCVGLTIVIFVVSISQLAAAVPQISKNERISSKILFFVFPVVPLQLIAIILWSALFGLYDELDDMDMSVTIGGGIGLLIVSMIVPIIAFFIATAVKRRNPGTTTTATSSTTVVQTQPAPAQQQAHYSAPPVQYAQQPAPGQYPQPAPGQPVYYVQPGQPYPQPAPGQPVYYVQQGQPYPAQPAPGQPVYYAQPPQQGYPQPAPQQQPTDQTPPPS